MGKESDIAKLATTAPSKTNGWQNYIGGVSNMIQPVTSDIMGIYDAYNQKVQTPLTNNFNVANYNELANIGPTYMDMSGFEKKSAKDIFIDSQFLGAAEGAAAGSSLGPWGALGGAISGNAMHLWKDLAHNNAGYRNYKQQVDSFNTNQMQNYSQNLTASYDKLNYDYMKNQKVNYAAFGGNLFNQSSGPFTEIKSGGSHEENPNGGVPQGYGSNGKQNLVEQGEVKYNDFMFSKRVYPTKEVLSRFKVPAKYFGLSAADIAKKLNLEAKERPADPISNTGQDTMLNRLQQAQEYQKIVNQAEQNGMTPEQYIQVMQQQQQQQSMENNQFAFGGNLFAGGGPKDPPLVFNPQNAQQTNQPPIIPQDNTSQRQVVQVQPQQIAEQQFQDFVNYVVSQNIYSTPQQIQEFISKLPAEYQTVANNIGVDEFYKMTSAQADAHTGTITQGKQYNTVQNWWRDFSQTQKGQEIVKFINSPVVQTAAMAVPGGAPMNIFLGAQLANEYGTGKISGNEAASTAGAFILGGKVLKQFAPLMSGEVALVNNARKGKNFLNKGAQYYNQAKNTYTVARAQNNNTQISSNPNVTNRPVVNSKQVVPFQTQPSGGYILDPKPITTEAFKSPFFSYAPSPKTPTSRSRVPEPSVESVLNTKVNSKATPEPTKTPTTKSTWKQPDFYGTDFTWNPVKTKPTYQWNKTEASVNKNTIRAVDAATFGLASFAVGAGVDVARNVAFIDNTETRQEDIRIYEDMIQMYNIQGNTKKVEEVTKEYVDYVKKNNIKSHIPQNKVVKAVLEDQGYITPEGTFKSTNSKTTTTTTTKPTSTTSQQPSSLIGITHPLVKNGKVSKVEGNITYFTNGSYIIQDKENGMYSVYHKPTGKGQRIETYSADNKPLYDSMFKDNQYIGDFDASSPTLIKAGTEQTTTSKTTGSTSNSSYNNTGMPNTRTSNYTPIDYNSPEAAEYNQKYDSVGNNWAKLVADWNNTHTKKYTVEQFKALARDGKYGAVHAFVKEYNPSTPQTTTTSTDVSIKPELGIDVSVKGNSYDWTQSVPERDFNPNNLSVTSDTTTETPRNNSDSWREAAMFFNPARMAPLFNDIYNIYNQQGADPTLAQSIRGAYQPVQAEQFGQQVAFTPFDWRTNEIAQRAKARAAQQSMMNIAGGNTAAATANLALQNTINQGDIAANYRQGIEYNNANQMNVMQFNNQLAQANAANRAQVNQYNNSNYMNSLINAAQIWDQEKKLIEQTRSQNQNNLAQNLGGVGQDYTSYNMIQNNPALLYSGIYSQFKGNK